MKKCWIGTLLVAVWLAPAGASAQTAWDSPMLLPPQPPDGLGIFLTDMHHGGLGVLGMWRSPVWNYGVRLGIGEGFLDEDLAVYGGVDYTGPINVATADLPIDVDWVLGVGAGISDGVRVSVPVGLSAAYSLQAEGARFTPYLTPRVVLDAVFGGSGTDDSDVGLDFAVDLGLDLYLTGGGGPLAGTTVRFGATLGDREAIAIGVLF